MASLSYLWRKRAKFPLGSNDFFRSWGKRLFSLPELFARNRSRNRLVNAGASIDETADIGEVDINGKKANLTVGANTSLGKVKIALHDVVNIGNRVCINDGTEILTASHDISDPTWTLVKGKVTIDDYVWIATGALIMPGVHIGRGAVVGAKAVVTKSVPPGSIVVGNPAKQIEKKRTDELDYDPCESLAANLAWLKG